MKTITLSKSRFASGLQCHKRLWIEKHQPEIIPPASPSQQAIFDQGNEVGGWAHQLFPDGILLEAELDFESHLNKSLEALSLRKPLFEPAFSIPGAYARADLLVPNEDDSWNLLEVKSSTNVWDDTARTQIKDVYLQDIAFQMYVYRAAGLNMREAFLVFLDRDYILNGSIDPQRLFRKLNVTGAVEALQSEVPIKLAALLQMLLQQVTPNTVIGPHCDFPYECSLKSVCWKEVPEDSVFTLTRVGAKAWAFWNSGTKRIIDLPEDRKYSPSQLIQINAEHTKQPHFDIELVRQFLDGLRYPLCFLDFETIQPAVPMFDGSRPYDQIPFQFSLHLQAFEHGPLTHVDHLGGGDEDPRRAFLEALRSSLTAEGSIVSYNSAFETARLRELSNQFPDHAAWISQALLRFENADLLKPFRSFALYHPGQHGSASIKAVLPAFTDLSYDDLAVQEGGTASNQFLRLLKGLVPSMEIPGLRKNLLDYCERDTFAMVKLIEKLRLMISSGTTVVPLV